MFPNEKRELSAGCTEDSVVPDPDIWSPIWKIYEIFLDPEPDWISFSLKADPDYPKRFEHFLIFLRFVFFLRKFY